MLVPSALLPWVALEIWQDELQEAHILYTMHVNWPRRKEVCTAAAGILPGLVAAICIYFHKQ